MILLQALSFLAGCVVLFAAPFFFLPDVDMGMDKKLSMAMSAIVLCALPYFLFGLAGHQTNQWLALRLLAGLLLAQMAIGGWLMMTVATDHGILLGIAAALLISVFLFITFVWPGTRHRSHRPMRRRDCSDQAVSINSSPRSW